MKRIVLAVFFVLGFALGAEEPILRVGIMTDTHIKETRESCAHVRKAFELFRAQKADLIVNCGDIADRTYSHRLAPSEQYQFTYKIKLQ